MTTDGGKSRVFPPPFTPRFYDHMTHLFWGLEPPLRRARLFVFGSADFSEGKYTRFTVIRTAEQSASAAAGAAAALEPVPTGL